MLWVGGFLHECLGSLSHYILLIHIPLSLPLGCEFLTDSFFIHSRHFIFSFPCVLESHTNSQDKKKKEKTQVTFIALRLLTI